ncbi:melanoma-associated antigen 10-like [Vulpes lagopus]|uniref:melanoma-associated antigen 10-like n=1 Tax=Vulpes lagopus TaxID=494514 RepID=UPI001BC90B37|nr:melanoma-associated antigen 10-like [Vulpes lagopus]
MSSMGGGALPKEEQALQDNAEDLPESLTAFAPQDRGSLPWPWSRHWRGLRDFKNWQRRPRSEAGVLQDTELRRRELEPLVQVQPQTDIMPLRNSREIWKQGEDLEEAQGLVDAQLSGAEEEEEGEEETAALVVFLLLKYHNKQPTSKAEMLEVFSPEYQDDFPTILSQTSRCMQLVFGLDVIEVDPSEHSYVLNPILGFTWDGMLSDQWGLPKTGLLGLVLGFILLQDGCVSEEEVWEALGFRGGDDGQEHIVCGEPGDHLTNVWMQEGYLESRQVAGSDLARNEFLWGPRASEETNNLQVMDIVLQVGIKTLRASMVL